MDLTEEIMAAYILAHQCVTPSTMKEGSQMIDTIRSIGGVQWGAEDCVLLSRLRDFESEWVRKAVETRELIEVHVLRGGLRIIAADEYPFYFAGTREVIERVSDRRLQISEEITSDHRAVLRAVSQEGRMTLKEIKKKTHLFNTTGLVNGLLGAGKLIRAGRRKNKVLFSTLEEWLPNISLDTVSAHQSRIWLAKKFLEIYGPSTTSELAHWVGWTKTAARKVIDDLAEEGLIEDVDYQSRVMLCSTKFPPREDQVYVRLLHNDDEIHLGCSKRCKALFGFKWNYNYSTTAAVLQNNRILGEIKIRKKKDILFVDADLPGVDTDLFEEQVERLAALWHATLDVK